MLETNPLLSVPSVALLVLLPCFSCAPGMPACSFCVQENIGRLCSRLHFPERFLSAYARLLACRLLPEWATWGLLSGKQISSDWGKLANLTNKSPIHLRLARARDAGNTQYTYRAFFENIDFTDSKGFTSSVDIFSGAAAQVCGLEMRVWKAVQHAFEARCPVPPEEQWRVSQVIADIAAARETLLLYTKRMQQTNAATIARSSANPPYEESTSVSAEERANDQSAEGRTVSSPLSPQTLFPADPGDTSDLPTSSGSDNVKCSSFEALVLTKTAWEIHLPSATIETRRLPPQPSGPDTFPSELRKSLISIDGLNIPRELQNHLEVGFTSAHH